MAKVNFELVEASIEGRTIMNSCEREWARCDLARPAAEIRVIAGIMNALEWIEQAAEQDGALYIRTKYDIAWLAQERSFHAALAIVRRQVTAMIEHLRTTTPEVTPEPELTRKFVLYHRGAYANVAPERDGPRVLYSDGRDDGSRAYIMPEGHYGPGFVVHRDSQGRARGYFLTTERYDDHTKPIAAAFLATLFPRLGIAGVNQKGYDEVEMEIGADGLRDIGAACYMAARTLVERCRAEVARLQWKGAPSAFTEADDDARDWLLEQMRAGATIERVRREGCSYNDADGVCDFTLSDGTPLAHTIVTRLQNADAIVPEGWPYSRSEQDGPLLPLVLNPRIRDEVVEPRRACVRFQAFQSYCAHRRHDGDRECAHPTRGGDTCSVNYCPLTTQVYSQDVGTYGLDFRDDPAFDYYDWERDSTVYAIHPNTRRSFAWRAAGEKQVEAIVNQVIRALVSYEVKDGRHLFGPENEPAARKAIEAGHLVLDEVMPGFGIVVKASDTLLAWIAEQQVKVAARSQEAEPA